MWKLTEKAEGQDPIPGVPWHDMTDEEFRAASREYSQNNGGAVNGFGPRALANSGYFEHVEVAAPKGKEDEPRREDEDDDPKREG